MDTPLYCISNFDSAHNQNPLFYIEDLQEHLRNNSFTSKPHRHDFYLLLYISGGSGVHWIDFARYEVKPGYFFVMTPGQVHYWDLKPDTTGYIICFMKDFYALKLDETSLLEFPFFQSNSSPLINVGHSTSVQRIIEDMFHESTHAAPLPYLRTYLDLLLQKVARHHTDDRIMDAGSASGRLRKLELLIEKHYKHHKSNSDYAAMMNMSPAHLNSLCKAAVGKTLSELISHRMMLEAKRLFAYTDLSIKEVAVALNFSTPTYFVRFFGKQSGMTPIEFKESLNRDIL